MGQINGDFREKLPGPRRRGNWSGLTVVACERADFIDRALTGGFPDAITRTQARRRQAWFDNYVQAILQRDVRDLANIEQLTEVPNLLQLIATRSASLLNFAELSRTADLAQSTLKRYFALLEMLFLVVRLPSWERNPGKRLVKAPASKSRPAPLWRAKTSRGCATCKRPNRQFSSAASCFTQGENSALWQRPLGDSAVGVVGKKRGNAMN